MISADTAGRIIQAGRLLTADGLAALRRLAVAEEKGHGGGHLEEALAVLEMLENTKPGRAGRRC